MSIVLAFSTTDSAVRGACPWGWPAHLPQGWMGVEVSWGELGVETHLCPA